VTTPAQAARARRLQGRRAGLVTRVLADTVDLVVALAIIFLLLLVIACVRFLVGEGFSFERPDAASSSGASLAVLVVYLSFGWATTGRTAGKALAGLRVLTDDGGDVSALRAIARAILCVVFIPGLFWAGFSRRNASLQDLILRTAVVYDWEIAPAVTPPAHPKPARREA
jgi:uncharacterized RDD family membrane protein YckC